MRIQDVTVDPDLENFLPKISADEAAELERMISEDGWTEPIIVWMHHGDIVDGHHRFRIWEKLGKDPDNCPDIIEKAFPDKYSVKAWMFRRQNARRNMTPAQRAEVALKMKPEIAEKAAERKGGRPAKKPVTTLSPVSEKTKTRKEVAKLADVSEGTVAKVETVLARGTPEVKAAMSAGEMSASKAYQETVGKPSHGTSFDPSEWDSAVPPDVEKRVAKADKLIGKLAGNFASAHEQLGPVVRAIDDILEADKTYGRKHKELLAHHSRLYAEMEAAKATLAAFRASWNRK